jgi:hypothetical protein
MDLAYPHNTVVGTRHPFPTRVALAATRPTENSGTVAIVIVLLAIATIFGIAYTSWRATPSIVVTKQGPANNTPQSVSR